MALRRHTRGQGTAARLNARQQMGITVFRQLVWFAAFLATFVPVALPAQSERDLIKQDTLIMCLPRNGGVIAGRRLNGGSGFDYRLSEQIADRLGLTLEVLWIEPDLEEESDPVRETYALLSARLCDAHPGHLRYENAVGVPGFDRASLPRWLGMPQEIDPDTGHLRDTLQGFVDVRPITVTQGYMRSEIGLVYWEGAAEPDGIGRLGGQELALQQGTLSGAIATLQTAPIDRANLVTMNPGAGFLWEVENAKTDLAIVDVAAYDSHLKANPVTPLRLAAWRHTIGMDIGIAVLSENRVLLAELDRVLEDILSEGVLPIIALAEGMTYAPPKSSALSPKLTLESLRKTP